MNIFKYLGVVIVDSKKVFDSSVGIKSLGDVIFVEYGDYNFGFSGFKRLNSKMEKYPLLLSINKEEKTAYLFCFIKDVKTAMMVKRIKHTLITNDFTVKPIRKELEELKYVR